MIRLYMGLWGFEIQGERAQEAAEDLEGRYDRLYRLAAITPYDLDYSTETEGWIDKVEKLYGVKIKVF